jgi:hypothetical protein
MVLKVFRVDCLDYCPIGAPAFSFKAGDFLMNDPNDQIALAILRRAKWKHDALIELVMISAIDFIRIHFPPIKPPIHIVKELFTDGYSLIDVGFL